MRTRIFILMVVGAIACAACGDEGANLRGRFEREVRPFVQTYCASCHAGEKRKGGLDLSGFATMQSTSANPRVWKRMREQIESGEMPPESAKAFPSDEARKAVVKWIGAAREFEMTRNAGDPGPVFARRLNNAEYDYTIRDLTGVDIRPAREFPVDPANEAGFDNSSESLSMSPALLKKYLAAARLVSDHLVLTPDGMHFAPYAVVTDTDRDKYYVNRIVGFYRRHRTDYADYFEAAWRYKMGGGTFEELAEKSGISARYLRTIHALLNEGKDEVGPVAALQAMWRELPDDPAKAREGCEHMREFVVELRRRLVPRVNNLTSPKIQNGSQPLVLWKNRQFAANRMRYAGGALKFEIEEGLRGDAAKAMTVPKDAAAAQKYEATFGRFCAVFPDAFYVSERARVYLDPEKEKSRPGRLLSAGFHSQMGYFRDDGPLYELMLSADERAELDRLWRELDFVASAPVRQYTGFIWFERTDSSFMRDPEFDFARAEDKDCTSVEKMKRLEEVYLAKAVRNNASDMAVEAIRDYFANMSATFRWMEKAHREAEPKHLDGLVDFAQRAYRRPLADAERDNLLAFYRKLRNELTHEEAMRDTIASVLVSPHFCFRVDRAVAGDGAVRPLDDFSLASRLSYFLWSSMPDGALLRAAEKGELRRPEVLMEQARRMMQDGRVRGLAVEFGGNWLDFRRFEEHNGVDRARFSSFDNALRQAMFEEPVRFFTDIVHRNGSVLDFLYADHTFVNGALAKHYGMSHRGENWVRVKDANQFGRGGLLPMSVFLTKNSPGLRTSPVKRGYWVVRKVLGEHIPPPPPTVPELPADEAQLGELTLRQTLERHRSDRSCAACHERFDAMGLVFEGYGPIGEKREKDLGGKPVENKAAFPGGGEGTGLEGLRRYIREKRQEDIVDHLCREILAYGLGRTLLLSDEPTVEEMKRKLIANGYRFETLVECVITSPQFRSKRTSAQVARRTP